VAAVRKSTSQVWRKLVAKKKCEENYYFMYVLKVLRVACMGVAAGLNCGCGKV
jgi:hypothetical protein